MQKETPLINKKNPTKLKYDVYLFHTKHIINPNTLYQEITKSYLHLQRRQALQFSVIPKQMCIFLIVSQNLLFYGILHEIIIILEYL